MSRPLPPYLRGFSPRIVHQVYKNSTWLARKLFPVEGAQFDSVVSRAKSMPYRVGRYASARKRFTRRRVNRVGKKYGRKAMSAANYKRAVGRARARPSASDYRRSRGAPRGFSRMARFQFTRGKVHKGRVYPSLKLKPKGRLGYPRSSRRSLRQLTPKVRRIRLPFQGNSVLVSSNSGAAGELTYGLARFFGRNNGGGSQTAATEAFRFHTGGMFGDTYDVAKGFPAERVDMFADYAQAICLGIRYYIKISGLATAASHVVEFGVAADKRPAVFTGLDAGAFKAPYSKQFRYLHKKTVSNQADTSGNADAVISGYVSYKQLFGISYNDRITNKGIEEANKSYHESITLLPTMPQEHPTNSAYDPGALVMFIQNKHVGTHSVGVEVEWKVEYDMAFFNRVDFDPQTTPV